MNSKHHLGSIWNNILLCKKVRPLITLLRGKLTVAQLAKILSAESVVTALSVVTAISVVTALLVVTVLSVVTAYSKSTQLISVLSHINHSCFHSEDGGSTLIRNSSTFPQKSTSSYYSSSDLTLILLTWRKWWAPNNASKQQMGFNSGFKGLNSNPFNPYFLRSILILPFHLNSNTPRYSFPSSFQITVFHVLVSRTVRIRMWGALIRRRNSPFCFVTHHLLVV